MDKELAAKAVMLAPLLIAGSIALMLLSYVMVPMMTILFVSSIIYAVKKAAEMDSSEA